MQPHSVAVLNIAGYVTEKSISSATVQLDYRNSKGEVKRKIYDASFSTSGNKVSGRISSRQGYECRFNLSISGREYTLRHGHDPVTERCKIDDGQIYGGSISGSRIKNGSFSGRFTSDKKYLTVRASTTGSTYEAKIL